MSGCERSSLKYETPKHKDTLASTTNGTFLSLSGHAAPTDDAAGSGTYM